MNRKQKLALFVACYKADFSADFYEESPSGSFHRGVMLGYRSALVDLGLLSTYEKWKSEQEE